jgi:hypothetical protein
MAHESNHSQFFYPAIVNHDMFSLQTTNYDHQLPINNSWRGFFSEDETLNKGKPEDGVRELHARITAFFNSEIANPSSLVGNF